MSWWKPEEKKGNTGETDDLELKPEHIKTQLAKLDTIGSTLKTEMSAELDEKLKPMNAFVERMNAAKEEADRKKQTEQRTQQQEADPLEWVSDPETAARRLIQPTNQALLTLAARSVKSDVLGEKEYYHGDFKSKVDSLIAKQSLQNQADPGTVENCYKVILADHITEISDGKLKTRAQAANLGGNGTGGYSGNDNVDVEEKLSDQEKQVAAKFGLSDKEYIAAKKETQYV